jgi:hypothetical protein
VSSPLHQQIEHVGLLVAALSPETDPADEFVLSGTDLAPFPLGVFNAGLHGDLYNRLIASAPVAGMTCMRPTAPLGDTASALPPLSWAISAGR